jgi:hypothetical protein
MITDVVDEDRLESAQAYLDGLVQRGARLSMRLSGDPWWQYWIAKIRMPESDVIHGAIGPQQESAVIGLAEQAGWIDPWRF